MNTNTLAVFGEYSEKYPLQTVAAAAYAELNQTAPLGIEIAFVNEDEIKRLNADNRGIDRVTDVLSFPYQDGIKGKIIDVADFADDIDPDSGNLIIGSVAICEKRAEEQAAEYGHSVVREVCYLALHGILHCFGYDHIEKADEEEMTALAEKIMNKINLTRDIV